MLRDPPSIQPTVYNLTSASTLTSPSALTVGRQQPFAGHNLNVSQHPLPHNTVSSSSHQITHQRLGYSSTGLSPDTGGKDAGPDEDEDARPCTDFQAMIQGLSSDADEYRSSKEQGGQSGRRVSRKLSRRREGPSDSSPTPIDSLQFNPDELRKPQARNPASAHPRGAGKSSTNPQSTLGGGDSSRRDVRGVGSGKLASHENHSY